MHTIPLWLTLVSITFVYMTLWYRIALHTNRYDVVDSAWGLGFVLVAWVSVVLTPDRQILAIVAAGLVSLWGIRLFVHISSRNWRKSEDDHRYQQLRARWGSAERRKFYTNVFLLQGVLILAVSTPVIAIVRANNNGFIIGVVTGCALWLFGIGFEAVADWQLTKFLAQRPVGAHTLMITGLWKYSRHPNYFGEITAWWGAGLVACSLGAWWGLVGSATITYLILKVSGVPPLEKHYKNNKDYQTYAQKTSVLIPRAPKGA